jgi:hypothetical protein
MSVEQVENLSISPAAVIIEEKIEQKEKSQTLNLVLSVILIILFLLLCYYSYCRFVENSIQEPLTSGINRERDDPGADYNLYEKIKELEYIQNKVLNSLSKLSE